MGTTEIKAPAGLPFVDITRSFKASPELLFRAHSEPDLLARWLGPRKYALIIDRYDVSDGGSGDTSIATTRATSGGSMVSSTARNRSTG